MPLFGGVVPDGKPAPDSLMAALAERVRAEIGIGRPVLLWNAFTTAEWDVVAGFDDERALYLGRGSCAGTDGYAQALQTRPRDCAGTCPAFGAIFVGPKTGSFDAPAAELGSLREALDHAYSRRNTEKLCGGDWVFLEGLAAYERWTKDFRSPEKTRGPGDAYCYGIYRSTHRAASSYLAELAEKHLPAKAPLLQASRAFAEEARILDEGEPLLSWSSPVGPDAARNQRAAELLGRSSDSYRLGIKAIEEALVAL